MNKTVKILSIDGGGIRGLIPAMVLVEIEKRTGKPIHELFDLIAGTSTGGILALGLVCPDKDSKAKMTAQDLVDLYTNEGPKIFKRSLLRTIFTLGGLIRDKYSGEEIEKVLDQYFGNAELKQSLTETLVTGYEIERRISWFFKSSKAKNIPSYNFLMKDIARSTSAAPTYFPPKLIKPESDGDYFTLIDGGVYANNPALCGYVEAMTLYPEMENFMLVSLGTGEQTERISYDKAKSWGLANWARPILGVVFDGVSDTIDYQLRQIIKPAKGIPMYYRFQVVLEDVNEALDEASQENIRNLRLLGEDLVRTRGNEIDLLCENLLGTTR